MEITREIGEVVDYNGTFPFDKVERLIQENILHCDHKLIYLTKHALNTRMDDHVGRSELTHEDVCLSNYIVDQHARLKKLITGQS